MKARIFILGLFLLMIAGIVIAQTFDLGKIMVQVIKVEPRGEYSGIKIKITNKSGKHLNQCEMSCILYRDKTEVDVETHYVIKSTEGGLDAGRSIYFEYVFSVSTNQFNRIGFNIESIR